MPKDTLLLSCVRVNSVPQLLYASQCVFPSGLERNLPVFVTARATAVVYAAAAGRMPAAAALLLHGSLYGYYIIFYLNG